MKLLSAATRARHKVGHRGFSIIESLIAMTLMAFAILSMFGLIATTYGYTEQDSEHIQSVAVGQQYLDAVRQAKQNSQTLPSPPTVAVDPGFGLTMAQIASTQNFVVNNNACPLVPGSGLLYNCTVTVTWTEAGAAKSVAMQSYVLQN
jgi:Tfp pilus assembly protein PilV